VNADGANANDANTNDYNVVFRPSTDPEAFDNSKIGAARVHRYARDGNDDDTGTEYVMWYHGRDSGFDAEGKLPPLTTGRIGRATSRNGLYWERSMEGSASEDVSGVSLGLNNESWWGFDTAHVGLGQVMLPMSTPAVMTEGGVYLMYYMGGNFEETRIGQYLDKDIVGTSSTEVEEATIMGMNMKIGIALSQDGIAFGRVEGDDPSGAVMAPYSASDPNMKYMKALRDEDGSLLNLPEELYCGWPEVAVNDVPADERINDGTMAQRSFYMFYSTMLKDTKEKAIAVAVGDDGFKWDKRGIGIQPSADGTGMDNGGCARCTIVKNAKYNNENGNGNGTWENTVGWLMFYEGVSLEDGKHRVMAAESMNLREWTKLGVVLDIGSEGSWDSDGVGAPHLLRLDDGTTRMYYTGQGKDGSTAIGVAKCEDNEVTEFVREQAVVTFSEE